LQIQQWNVVKEKLELSNLGPQSINRAEKSYRHGNRARQITKIFDSLYKGIPALRDFSVDVIDTEDYESKYNPKDQIQVENFSKLVIRDVFKLSEEEIFNRLKFKREELPSYKLFSPYSGIFFIINFTLRENLNQEYSLTKIKHVIEALYTKMSSYDYVPIILTHKLDQTSDPVDTMIGIKETIFKKESFSQQKYKAQVMKAKEEILDHSRKRLLAQIQYAQTLGSVEAEKIATFLELFMQGCTLEERYFVRISLIDIP
jgi:hypothetical protein